MSQIELLFGVSTLAGAGVLAAVAARRVPDTASLGVEQIDEFYAAPAATPHANEPIRQLPAILDVFRRLSVRILRPRSIARIEHLLDIAGNPQRWDLPRVLASKSAA